ncbi:MAG: CxxC-x17-CxxC domain-containing protein [Patescibacteria group bacterium]
MGNFNRGGDRHGGGFNRDRGGDRRGGGGFNRDRGERPTMHQAVCDACHKSCEVPFKPSGDKPIFCSDCFSKQGGGNRGNDRRGGDRGGDRDRRPSFEDRSSGAKNNDTKDILKSLKTLNYKFDELLKALSPHAPAEEKTESNKKASSNKVVKQKTSKKKVASKKKKK